MGLVLVLCFFEEGVLVVVVDYNVDVGIVVFE